MATCAKCNLQYVGSTLTEIKVRFCNHKSHMLKNKRNCELAIHFNDSEHEISQINFIIIEQVRSFENSSHLEQLLLTRKTYCTVQLFALNPQGLNKRQEFRSKHHIIYYNWVVVICHFSNMKYLILILILPHYHFWYLFIPEFKSPFQGCCYVCHRFFKKEVLDSVSGHGGRTCFYVVSISSMLFGSSTVFCRGRWATA